MKTFVIALGALAASSCAKSVAPAAAFPVIEKYASTKNFDETWDRALQYFAQKHIDVQHANKTDGYIITEPVPVSWASASANGPGSSNAEVLLQRNGRAIPLSQHVSARYKVKISEGDGKIMIAPSVEAISLEGSDRGNGDYVDGKSTGLFEKKFVKSIQ